MKKKKIILIIAVFILVILTIGITIYYMNNGKKNEKGASVEIDKKYDPYRITTNSLTDFDLYFMQLENKKTNLVYSPLSIKYALQMLADGSDGVTKQQITNIVGEYKPVKYTNSNNMSFANAMFIKDSYKENINQSYTKKISNKYNAELLYDSFSNPDNINKWVSNKTFNLVNNLMPDVSDLDYILINALAIDMNWKKNIMSDKSYFPDFPHENFENTVPGIWNYFRMMDFYNAEGTTIAADGLAIAATANKYDIEKDLGKDKIKEIVRSEYIKWYNDNIKYFKEEGYEPAEVDEWMNNDFETFYNELVSSYKHMSSSTDFKFYIDDNVKAISKELKEYDSVTLEYIGIMPINDELSSYVSKVNANDINKIIKGLKPLELDSFEDGVVTKVHGQIPTFGFDYNLDLISDLKKLGITDVFDPQKADLSKLTSAESYISDAKHKANIDFSNEGIKAGAATSAGGSGGGSLEFDYRFEVPVKEINVTFDHPYLFIIRDKDSGEVWFSGTVYEPNPSTALDYR